MAARKWSSLSADYRARLERGGISRREYESGASLKAARGHKATPERPERAAKNPAKYVEYRKRQAVKKVKAKGPLTGRQVNDAIRKIAKRAGFDAGELIAALGTLEARQDYVAGWDIANAEWKVSGTSYYGRQRLDDFEQAFPELEKAIGYYH